MKPPCSAEAVHHGAHAELAHAVEDVVAADCARARRPWSLGHRQVGAGQVGRAADQLRQRGHERVEHVLRGFARGDRFGLLRRSPAPVRSRRVGEVRRQLARHAPLELGGLGGELLLVGVEAALPAPCSARLPALAGVPAGVDRSPASRTPGAASRSPRAWRRSPRRRAARRAPRRCWPSSARPCAIMVLQQISVGRLLSRLGLADRRVDRLHVVAVDARDHLPAVRSKRLRHVVGVPAA